MTINHAIIYQVLESAQKFLAQIEVFFDYYDRLIKKKVAVDNIVDAIEIFLGKVTFTEEQLSCPHFLGKIETNYYQTIQNEEDPRGLLTLVNYLKNYEALVVSYRDPGIKLKEKAQIVLQQDELIPLSMGVIQSFERVLMQRIEMLTNAYQKIEEFKKEKRQYIRQVEKMISVFEKRKKAVELEITHLRQELKKQRDRLSQLELDHGSSVKSIYKYYAILENRIYALNDRVEAIKQQKQLLLEKMSDEQETLQHNERKQMRIRRLIQELKDNIALFKEKGIKKSMIEDHRDNVQTLQEHVKLLTYLIDNLPNHVEYIRFLKTLAEKKYQQKMQEQAIQDTCLAETISNSSGSMSLSHHSSSVTVSVTQVEISSSPQSSQRSSKKHKSPVAILSLEEYREKYGITSLRPTPQKVIPEKTFWENFKIAVVEFLIHFFLWTQSSQTLKLPIMQVGLFAHRPEPESIKPVLDTLEPIAVM